MSWAKTRKSLYIGFMVVITALIIGAFLWFNKPLPTCFDNKQNQDENGVDCGGVCNKVCEGDALDPIPLWFRFVEADAGIYHVLAYVQNPNIDFGATDVGYSFKLYDEAGTVINKVTGITDIPAHRNFGIFEPSLATGSSIPVRIKFEFTTKPAWVKTPETPNRLVVLSRELTNASTSPKLTVNIANNTLSKISNIEIIPVLYDVNKNTISFSRTLIKDISAENSTQAVFTWRKPITDTVTEMEILIKENVK